MTTDYRPISCHMYAELELAIMHQIRVRMAWFTVDGQTQIEPVLPTDLRTQASEEFLLAENGCGQPLEIRLDRIVRFMPL